MFSPRYFPVRHFAPRYFPPGGVVVFANAAVSGVFADPVAVSGVDPDPVAVSGVG